MKNQIKPILIFLFLINLFFSCNQKVKNITKTEIELVDVDLSITKTKFPLIAKALKTHTIIDSKTRVEFKSDKFEYGIEELTYPELFEDVTSNWENEIIIKTPNSFLGKTNNGEFYAEEIMTIKNVEYSCSKNNIKTEKEATKLLKIMKLLKAK